jgi:hypothetical protein
VNEKQSFRVLVPFLPKEALKRRCIVRYIDRGTNNIVKEIILTLEEGLIILDLAQRENNHSNHYRREVVSEEGLIIAAEL